MASGQERNAEELQLEFETLLAPYDFCSKPTIQCWRPPKTIKRTVPNYGACFDFWDVDKMFSEKLTDELSRVEVEHMIYTLGGNLGHEVIATSNLPPGGAYDALVTPDGRYHDLWTAKESPEEAPLARKEAILREHSDCLAVVCKAHV